MGGFPRGRHSAIPDRDFARFRHSAWALLRHSAIPAKISYFHSAHRRNYQSHSVFRLLKKAHSVIPPSRKTSLHLIHMRFDAPQAPQIENIFQSENNLQTDRGRVENDKAEIGIEHSQ